MLSEFCSMFHIERGVTAFIGGGGKTWLVIGLAVLLFGYAGWQFIGGLFDRKSKKQEQADSTV